MLLLVGFLLFCSALGEPRDVHLSLTGDITQMAVAWLTPQSTKESAVKYGVSQTTLVQIAYGSESTYNESVGYLHHVIGSNAVYSFTTGPSRSFERPLKIPTFGDMGVRKSNTTIPHLTKLAESGAVDFFLHVGDISYADDYSASLFEQIWEDWFALMKGVQTVSPYMTCAGNHESVCGEDSCANYTGHFAPYLHRFRMPYKESGSPSNMYHSFNYAGVHFVAINTETDFAGSPEADQGGFGDWISWFEKDLQKVNRSQTPWIVVFGHRPIYSTSQGYSDIFGYPTGAPYYLQKAVEDILYKYQVDLYICGHVHTYERTLPGATVYKSNAVGNFPDISYFKNPKAPIHIVSGAAGCIEDLSNRDWESWEWGSEEWSWFGYRFGTDYGYGMITVFNATHLEWEFFRSSDNGLEDHFYIVRSN